MKNKKNKLSACLAIFGITASAAGISACVLTNNKTSLNSQLKSCASSIRRDAWTLMDDEKHDITGKVDIEEYDADSFKFIGNVEGFSGSHISFNKYESNNSNRVLRGIGANAFIYNKGVSQTITLPDSATFIDENAFRSTNVTGLIVKSDYLCINEGAFLDCPNFKDIWIKSKSFNIFEFIKNQSENGRHFTDNVINIHLNELIFPHEEQTEFAKMIQEQLAKYAGIHANVTLESFGSDALAESNEQDVEIELWKVCHSDSKTHSEVNGKVTIHTYENNGQKLATIVGNDGKVSVDSPVFNEYITIKNEQYLLDGIDSNAFNNVGYVMGKVTLTQSFVCANAFNNTGITDVVFTKNNIRAINDNAFANCQHLNSICFNGDQQDKIYVEGQPFANDHEVSIHVGQGASASKWNNIEHSFEGKSNCKVVA